MVGAQSGSASRSGRAPALATAAGGAAVGRDRPGCGRFPVSATLGEACGDLDDSLRLAPAQSDLPLLGRLAGRGSTMTLEQLVLLAPDLVIDAGSVTATYRSMAERVAQQTGIPYLLVDGRLEESAQQLREV